MLADGEGLRYSQRKMMPTVGCEADAIAFTEDSAVVFAAGDPAAVLDGSGAYGFGPGDLSSPDLDATAVEHCLPLGGAGQQVQRVRVVHALRRMTAQSVWRSMGVELHAERYDSPHSGRVELQGCGGGLESFSATEPLAEAALGGAWTASGLRFAGGGAGAEAVEAEAWSFEALRPTLLRLPLGVWSSCVVEGDSLSLAAGVLLEGGAAMRVATREVRGGQLSEARLLTLERSA